MMNRATSVDASIPSPYRRVGQGRGRTRDVRGRIESFPNPATLHLSSILPLDKGRKFVALLSIFFSILAWTLPALALPKPNEIVQIGSLKLDHSLAPGGASNLLIDATVLPGWHINSNHPLSEDYIATAVRVDAPASITVGTVQYPKAEEVALEFSGGDKLSVFSGFLMMSVPLTASIDFKPAQGQELTVSVDYQACDNLQCLRPTSVSSTVDLTSLQTAAGDNGTKDARAGSAALAGVVGGGSSGGGGGMLDDVFTRHGSILGFLAVLLGGLALNLTPCVYPLIGVTVAYFGNQGGGPRSVLVLAILYVLGIALMFSAVGVAVALSGGLFGAAMQNPIVLTVLATMMVGLALSSFGVFSLQPPQWLMNRAGIARPGYVGSLAMGLGMGVVAAPCIGPIVLGLLLMVERSESPLFGFALFFTLAVGLGLPYIALALAAGSIRQLPRSGEWLAWVEQLFGFVLI